MPVNPVSTLPELGAVLVHPYGQPKPTSRTKKNELHVRICKYCKFTVHYQYSDFPTVKHLIQWYSRLVVIISECEQFQFLRKAPRFVNKLLENLSVTKRDLTLDLSCVYTVLDRTSRIVIRTIKEDYGRQQNSHRKVFEKSNLFRNLWKKDRVHPL